MSKNQRTGGIVLGIGLCGFLFVSLLAHHETRENHSQGRKILQVQLAQPKEESKLAAASMPEVADDPSSLPETESKPPRYMNDDVQYFPTPTEPKAASAAAHDPDKAAEEFVERTRKEATAAVESLTSEAAQLRERLIKVEAGLAKYRATLEAICPTTAEVSPPATNDEPQLSPVALPKTESKPKEENPSAGPSINPPPTEKVPAPDQLSTPLPSEPSPSKDVPPPALPSDSEQPKA